MFDISVRCSTTVMNHYRNGKKKKKQIYTDMKQTNAGPKRSAFLIFWMVFIFFVQHIQYMIFEGKYVMKKGIRQLLSFMLVIIMTISPATSCMADDLSADLVSVNQDSSYELVSEEIDLVQDGKTSDQENTDSQSQDNEKDGILLKVVEYSD